MNNQTAQEALSDKAYQDGYKQALKEINSNRIVIIGNKGYLLTASQLKRLKDKISPIAGFDKSMEFDWSEALNEVELHAKHIFTANEVLNY